MRFAFVILILAELVSPLVADDSSRVELPPPIRILVPAYFYPAGEGLKTWEQLIASHAPEKKIELVAIANINSGKVGTAVDPNYAQVIRQATKKGIKVIGYITSDYANLHGQCSLDSARENVTNWFKLYPELDGIFVDEQTSDGVAIESYYEPLRRHINALKANAFVVGNPGNNCAESYVAKRSGGPIMDVVVVHENNESKLIYESAIPADWMARYPPERFAVLVHTSKSFAPQIKLAKNRHTGYVFVTDAVGPPPESIHPWGKLPSYWSDELALVQELNGHAPKKDP